MEGVHRSRSAAQVRSGGPSVEQGQCFGAARFYYSPHLQSV